MTKSYDLHNGRTLSNVVEYAEPTKAEPTSKTFAEQLADAKKLGPVAEAVLLSSPVARRQLQLERDQADAKAAVTAQRAEAKPYEGKPHHQKLAELRALNPLMATIYEQNNAFALRVEREEDPPPTAA